MWERGDWGLAVKLQMERDEQKKREGRLEKQGQGVEETKEKNVRPEIQKTWDDNEEEWPTESESESSGVGTTDEEDPEDLLDDTKEVHTKHEDKAHAALNELRDKLRNKSRALYVGDIQGKWTLYSSGWVDKLVNEKYHEIDDNWKEGVGTIRFGRHLIGEANAPYAGDMGMELTIEDGVRDASPSQFYKPKYASVELEALTMYDENEEEDFTINIGFLGNGYLELYYDDIYFVGIHVQDRKAVEREREETDLEWQNDKYTGHLHPANIMTTRTWLEACGVEGDPDDYGYGYGHDDDF
jgi:hypothetical protein